MNRTAYLVSILVLLCLANAARFGFRSRMGNAYMHAESASHYRYTWIVANGEGIPSLDKKAQWPEGLEVSKVTSVAMEYFYGTLYRPLKRFHVPFSSFMRFIVPFFFSLAIFPVSFISERLWRSRGAGVISALLFAVSLPLVARSSGFEYIREDFAVPLIILSLYFFLFPDGRVFLRGTLSAAFLFAALAAWHGTQFYMLPLLAFVLIRSVFFEPSIEERWSQILLTGSMLTAAFVVPYLRAADFILSIPMALAIGVLAVDVFSLAALRGTENANDANSMFEREDRRQGKGFGWKLRLASVAVVAVGAVILFTVLSRRNLTEYSHFFSMILYKLRYIEKPSDPKMLPFVVRAFWVGPFNSPDALHFFVFELPITLTLAVPLERLIKRKPSSWYLSTFFLYFLAVSFVLVMLIQRLGWMYGLFAAIAAGGNITEFSGWRSEGRRISFFGWLLIAVAAISLVQDFAWEGRADVWKRFARVLKMPEREKFVVYPYSPSVEGELFGWIKKYTKKDSVIMTLHYLSPQILTYTGRPTNLNDFFESVKVREKARRLLESLYAGEDRLYDFCRGEQSDYLLVSIAIVCNPTKDSPLYQAGLLNIPQGSAAFKLIFAPERLNYFRLVYENEMYRLYRVGASSVSTGWPRSPLFYERKLLWKLDGDLREFYNYIMRIYALTARAKRLVALGQRREAEETLVEALRMYYFYPAWKMLDSLYREDGRFKDKDRLADFAYPYDPNRVDVSVAEIESRIRNGETEKAEKILERTLALRLGRSDRNRLERLKDEIEHMR